METNKIEIAEVERVVKQEIDGELRELADMQLALIGGGIGEVIVA
jgi:hypothetical protein